MAERWRAEAQKYAAVMSNPHMWGISGYPAATCAASLAAAAIRGFQQPGRPSRGLPTRAALVANSLGFAVGSYTMLVLDDEVNGASMATAWGTLYSGVYAASSIRSRRPVPVALATLVAFATYFYGRETLGNYF